MKQILMSKEEYDQLMLDMDNLKKEKEQLNEQNAELNKKVDRLKKMIERGKGNEFMYLNQITTIYSHIDMELFIDKLKYDAKTYFWKYENITDKLVLTEPIMQFFDSIEETFFKSCLKTDTEETTYEFCVTEQLLYGTLLQDKLSEVSRLRFKIYELHDSIDKLQTQIVKKDNECKYQISRYEGLREEYNLKCTKCIDLQRTIELRDSYAIRLDECIKENRQLNNNLRSLSQKLNYYQNCLCIKLPKWAMRIMKHLKRDKGNERE